jgi:hypothetical protein
MFECKMKISFKKLAPFTWIELDSQRDLNTTHGRKYRRRSATVYSKVIPFAVIQAIIYNS